MTVVLLLAAPPTFGTLNVVVADEAPGAFVRAERRGRTSRAA
jgi:hypothetical protein